MAIKDMGKLITGTLHVDAVVSGLPESEAKALIAELKYVGRKRGPGFEFNVHNGFMYSQGEYFINENDEPDVIVKFGLTCHYAAANEPLVKEIYLILRDYDIKRPQFHIWLDIDGDLPLPRFTLDTATVATDDELPENPPF